MVANFHRYVLFTVTVYQLFLHFFISVTGYSTGFDQCRDEPGHGTERSPPNGASTAYALRLLRLNTLTNAENVVMNLQPFLNGEEEFHIELYSPANAGLTFKGFIMNAFTLPFNGYTNDTPVYGNLVPLTNDAVRSQEYCNGGITHTDPSIKTSIRAKWIPPTSATTLDTTLPLLLTAIVTRDYHAWYRSTLCVEVGGNTSIVSTSATVCPSYFSTPFDDVNNILATPFPSITSTVVPVQSSFSSSSPLSSSSSAAASSSVSPIPTSSESSLLASSWSSPVSLTPFLSLSWKYLPGTSTTDSSVQQPQRPQRRQLFPIQPYLFTEPVVLGSSFSFSRTTNKSSSFNRYPLLPSFRQLSSSTVPALHFRLVSNRLTWVSIAIAANDEGSMSDSDAIVIQLPNQPSTTNVNYNLNDIIHQYSISGHSFSSVVRVPDDQQTLLATLSSFRYHNPENVNEGYTVEFARPLLSGSYPNAKAINWDTSTGTVSPNTSSSSSSSRRLATSTTGTPFISAWGIENSLVLDRHLNRDILSGRIDFSAPFRGQGNTDTGGGGNTLVLFTNKNSTINRTITLILHIAFMVVAWIILVPFGIFIMRKKQNHSPPTTTTTSSFCCGVVRFPMVHAYVQTIALGCTFLGVILGILTVPSDRHFTEFHHIVSITFIAISLLPVLVRFSFIQTGLVSFLQLLSRWNPKGSLLSVYAARGKVRTYHKYLGYFITLLSIIPIVTGILALENISYRYILLYVYLGIITIGIFGSIGYDRWIHEYYKTNSRRRERTTMDTTGNGPQNINNSSSSSSSIPLSNENGTGIRSNKGSTNFSNTITKGNPFPPVVVPVQPQHNNYHHHPTGTMDRTEEIN